MSPLGRNPPITTERAIELYGSLVKVCPTCNSVVRNARTRQHDKQSDLWYCNQECKEKNPSTQGGGNHKV